MSAVMVKLSPEGHLVPSTQMTLPSTPAPITLDSLQALQNSGLVFTPGPTPLPLPLQLGTLPHTGLGLGMSPFPTLAAAAAVSPMHIAGLNFGAQAAFPTTPLQVSDGFKFVKF